MNFRTDTQRRRNGGLTRAARMAHVIDGKLVTTAQVASTLGITKDAAYNRIRNRKHPLTWDALRERMNGRKS